MIEIIEHGAIHEIRMARPPVNALNPELLRGLIAAIDAAPRNGARALILSGGEKVFSGGLDVPYLMGQDRAGLAACWTLFFEAARGLARCPVPVAAAIAGHNPAGGCVLALCCDFRVMARGPFRIGLNETQVGLTVPDAIQYLMRRVAGTHRAEQLIVAGAMVESEQALAYGIVDALADAGDVVAVAANRLAELLALPSGPMLASRRIARADIIAVLESFDESDLDGFLDGWYSADSQAALRELMVRLKK